MKRCSSLMMSESEVHLSVSGQMLTRDEFAGIEMQKLASWVSTFN